MEAEKKETNRSSTLIFQCIRCKTIIGDSLALRSTNETLQIIALNGASNIQKCMEVGTSKTGIDCGCTYFSFSCEICKVKLGKFYVSTTKDLDSIREMFSFDINCISSYEIGKPKICHSKQENSNKQSASNQITDNISKQISDSCIEQQNKQLMPSVEDIITNSELAKEILKVQHVLLDILGRVAALEENDGGTAASIAQTTWTTSRLRKRQRSDFGI